MQTFASTGWRILQRGLNGKARVLGWRNTKPLYANCNSLLVFLSTSMIIFKFHLNRLNWRNVDNLTFTNHI